MLCKAANLVFIASDIIFHGLTCRQRVRDEIAKDKAERAVKVRHIPAGSLEEMVLAVNFL